MVLEGVKCAETGIVITTYFLAVDIFLGFQFTQTSFDFDIIFPDFFLTFDIIHKFPDPK